ncbi:hypothetical protein RA086_11625 [Lactiplantibacillus sp. WILCCON 0030]|uniref:Lipoprotein n=1 Tax=Lactiplantibacillus brownii TaxID=3069269 RepID=A0ABU1ABB3_9LACO|nr:hypothetical protein [Lactiplantibacillus brownii]MDQ7938259.1 hypothetical protein [Lactiplantibacillus brownii]
MKRVRGLLGIALILSIGLAGCQSATGGNGAADKQVSSATPTISAVSKVRTTDYLGRWVNSSERLALYLDANQRLALFQSGHTTIKGNFNLKLAKNNQATLTQASLGQSTLALTDATNMTLKTAHQTIQLTKDTGWSPQHSKLPATTKVALQGASLIRNTPLKP